MGYYFEIIPIGEVINSVKILGRSKTQLNNRNGESVFDCECMLCGAKIQRLASVIITGAVQPCNDCRIKYKMVEFAKR